MKTVFANEMVAHVWAQRNQDHGRSNNGNFYFKGDVIYSYRDSWPLAMFLDNVPRFSKLCDADVVINNESYGITTSQHLGDVYGALRGLNMREVRVGDARLMEKLVHIHQSGGESRDLRMIQELTLHQHERYMYHTKQWARLTEKYKSFKSAPSKHSECIDNILRHALMYNASLKELRGDERDFYGVKQRAKAITAKLIEKWTTHKHAIDIYNHEREAKRDEKNKERDRIRREAREARYENLKQYRDVAFETWRKCDSHSDPYVREAISHYIGDYMSETRLRAMKRETISHSNPELNKVTYEIQTSRGATVPLDDAKRFMKGVQLIVKDMEKKGLAFVKPDVPQSVGHFSLRHVSLTDRCVVIGCHSLHFDEINAFIDFAKQHQPELEITDEYKIKELVHAAA